MMTVPKYTRSVDIEEPAVLMRINKRYRPGMSDIELYDVTRGPWVIDSRREQATLALAVFGGIVKEIYEIAAWFPAGSTLSTFNIKGVGQKQRWEFVGRIADDRTRSRYIGHAVDHYFTTERQDPVHWANL